MKVGSLFSGIGGLERGLELAGMEVAFQAEYDKQARSVLRHRWPNVDKQLSLLSILSVGDSRAKITQLQESAAAWLATVARSGGKCTGPLLSAAPHGLSEKMYLGSCPVTEEPISLPSSSRLFNSGMASPGLLLTLNTSEWRNDGDACSLSDILEESPDPKYSLSPKACAGILRRAEKQGRELTPALGSALRAATTNEET